MPPPNDVLKSEYVDLKMISIIKMLKYENFKKDSDIINTIT